ncbi:MAG: hypothetical protein HQ567_22040 [Candidatus Nealsonbacteria bacterium]|nr:hypothetical protein [Candidatus Nealsonbacteria bacterium]
MIKKMVIVGGLALLVCGLVFGTSMLSYVSTSAGYVSESVRDSVPVGFEIDRARGMIKDLAPEVEKNMKLIAKEEVRVKRLQEQIAQSETRLKKEKDQILRLKGDLESARETYVYAGRDYTAEQVQGDLANRFKRYRTGEATLESWVQILGARQQSVAAARDKLEGMLAAKRQLEVEVENLVARQQMIAAAKATSQYQFDEGRLGRVKQLVANLQTRLDVADNLVRAETRFHDEIPLDEPIQEDIVNEVTDYFGQQSPEAETVALD